MDKNDIYDIAEDFIWFRFKCGCMVALAMCGMLLIGGLFFALFAGWLG